MQVPAQIRQQFGLAPDADVTKIGSGHINYTFLVKGKPSFILQRINTFIFKKPEIIANNICVAETYLTKNYPDYLFLAHLKSIDGKEMVYDEQGFAWRLFPYLENSMTLDQLESVQQAYSAAEEFGRLSAHLNECDVSQFHYSLERFHDLSWRYQQFQEAWQGATPSRLAEAEDCIQQAKHFSFLVDRYTELINGKSLRLRITHNDTKINNILFDRTSGKAMAAIDLDTLMPGYFIYDLGDMVRTYVSPVSEEEADVSKILFRKEFYDAVIAGYLSQMNNVLSEEEKKAIPLAGMLMTYIMALRFLADFLNGNIYYQIHYPNQNLVRARNQLYFLNLLEINCK